MKVGEIPKALQAPFTQEALESLLGPIQCLQLCGCRIVEIERDGLRLGWGIPVPVEDQVGLPEPGQIGGQLQQANEILC